MFKGDTEAEPTQRKGEALALQKLRDVPATP